MAVSKVTLNNEDLINLTDIGTNANNVLDGIRYIDNAGNKGTGTFINKLPLVVAKNITSILGNDLCGINVIGDYAFYNCDLLESVEIPLNIEFIGERAFDNCSSLTNLVLQNKDTIVDASSFKNCSNLVNITFNGEIAEFNYSSLKAALLMNSQEMTITCTDGTTYLNVSVGNMIITYSDDEVQNVPVTEIIHPIEQREGNFDSVYYHLNQETKYIKSIVIPEGVTILDESAFFISGQGIGSDSSVINVSITLPNSLQIIRKKALGYVRKCTTFEVPEHVTEIGEKAYYYDREMVSITIRNPNQVVTAGATIFQSNNNLAHIYVPANLVDSYKVATNWVEYASLIEAIPVNE